MLNEKYSFLVIISSWSPLKLECWGTTKPRQALPFSFSEQLILFLVAQLCVPEQLDRIWVSECLSKMTVTCVRRVLILQRFSSLTEFLTPFITGKLLNQYSRGLIENPWVWATDYLHHGVYMAWFNLSNLEVI